MRIRRKWLLTVPAVLACAAVVAACGSSSSSSSSATSTPSATTTTPATSAAVPSIESMVPAAIKSKGTRTVAADASHAPNEFIAPDGHTVIGMDPDLMKALAAVMGLNVKVVNVTFADIIPGMQAGKYD